MYVWLVGLIGWCAKIFGYIRVCVPMYRMWCGYTVAMCHLLFYSLLKWVLSARATRLVTRALVAYLMCRFNKTKRMIIRPTIPTGRLVGHRKLSKQFSHEFHTQSFDLMKTLLCPVETQNFALLTCFISSNEVFLLLLFIVSPIGIQNSADEIYFHMQQLIVEWHKFWHFGWCFYCLWQLLW